MKRAPVEPTGDVIDVCWYLYRRERQLYGNRSGWFKDDVWSDCWVKAERIVRGRIGAP